jgi:hypothetical protein
MTWYPLAWTAGAIVAMGVIWKSPIGTLLRWLLRRNIVQPLKAASRTLIHDTVGPLVDDVKANARAQHDEQNEKLAAIDSRLTDHSRRLSLIEDHITRPRGGL